MAAQGQGVQQDSNAGAGRLGLSFCVHKVQDLDKRYGKMAFIHEKHEKNFTMISNVALQDRRLSLRAKGLLVLCCSLPSSWRYSVAGLQTLSQDGSTALNTALRELEACGYLTRSRLRDAKGRMGGTDFRFYEIPQAHPEAGTRRADERQTAPSPADPPQAAPPPLDAPKADPLPVENPRVDMPDTDRPPAESMPLERREEPRTEKRNTYGKKKQRPRTKQPTQGAVGMPAELQTFAPEVRESFAEYVRMREEKSLPVSPWTLSYTLRRLRELAGDDAGQQCAILTEAIVHGWRDIYPPRETSGPSPSAAHGTQRAHGASDIQDMNDETLRLMRTSGLIR